MKKILIAAFVYSHVAFAGCKDPSESNMVYIEQMKDSIFKSYPTVASITIEIKDNRKLDVVLGDNRLFNANDIKRQKVAAEIGTMALRLFPKNTEIDKGELLVSDNIKDAVVDRNAAKTTAINIDSIRKSMK